jgi:prepilin-type N-terminal cleavage/methylation domain-containing protein
MDKNEKGFSLVELLVAITLMSTVVLFLVGIISNQYVSALAESARIRLRTEGQFILLNLQDELLFTIAYSETIESRLTDPYEPSGGWQYDRDPAILIINEIALDSFRRDESRNIVRQRVVNCEAASITSNPLAVNNELYFLEENAEDDYFTLFKRTIAPTYDTCSIDDASGEPCTSGVGGCRGNIKVSTCPLSLAESNNCKPDALLSSNVVAMDIQYFAEGNIAVTTPSAADKIQVSITLGKKVYGRDIEATVSHTIRKIN